MKGIKEKAEEYGLQYPVIHYDADGNTYDDVDKPSTDFEAGANYVLDEIESIMEDKELDVEEFYNEIYTTINQLKN